VQGGPGHPAGFDRLRRRCACAVRRTTGFSVRRPGIYRVRLARRNGDAEERARAAVRAAFDEHDWDGAAFRSAMDAIDVTEEYLVRFWPAAAGTQRGDR